LRQLLKALALATLLLADAVSLASPSVVVSSKLSSESAMIGQMIRLLRPTAFR
jgi:glycine betaine/choline ABC-type transport system substrate-binding protein